MGDIKEVWLNELAELEKDAINLTIEQRNKEVEKITELHYFLFNKYPSNFELQRLANVILIEDIKDRRRNKAITTEYSFHTDRQTKTRSKRELIYEDDTINFLHQKKVKRLDSTFKKSNKQSES